MIKYVALCIMTNMILWSQAEERDLIRELLCTKQSIHVVLHERLKEKKYVLEDFFVEYSDEEIDCTNLDYSIVTMPVIMNLIALIWASGDVYYIDAMDEQLYHSLEIVKEVFKRLYPYSSWDGKLIPRSLVDNKEHFLVPRKTDDYIAVLFSHGLDSICTSLRHSTKQQLLLTVWGHSDCPLGRGDVWENFSKRIIGFGKKFGHENRFFRSNYHTFMNLKYITTKMTPEIVSWRIDAVEGLGWVGLTAPILMSKGYTKLYIGSSYCWGNPYPQAAIPLIDHNIHYAGIDIVHDGFDMPRVQKNKYLAEECIKRRITSMPLRVCSRILRNEEQNCGLCEKCLRTMTGFLVLGEQVKKFGFDMSNQQAIQSVKKRLYKFKVVDRVSWYWRIIQKVAQENVSKLGPMHHSFAKWFIEQDLDKITIFRPIKKINWKDFVDIYDKIPQEFLN